MPFRNMALKAAGVNPEEWEEYAATLPPSSGGGNDIFDVIRGATKSAGDFISDPTGRKGAASDMASILRDQMTRSGEQRDQYLGEFSGLAGMGREAATEYLGHDYGEMLPDQERYRSQLNMADYGGPEAQRHQFDPFSVEEDPAYQFAKEQGLGQIERRAAAGSGSLGPATSKAMADYTVGLASQYGNDAFNRWQTQQNMEYGAGRDYYGDQVNQGMRRAGLDIGQEMRDYGYGQDYYGNQVGNVLNQYNVDQGQAGFGMNLQQMRDPQGFIGQQSGMAGQLANARGMQGGPAFWDLANLVTNVAGAATPFF